MSTETVPQAELKQEAATAESFTVKPEAVPSLSKAVLAGGLAALFGALAWATITVATKYQIGWMAIGVGCLVGFMVRRFGRGHTPAYGYLGAGISLLGCVLGNALSLVGFVCVNEAGSFFQNLELIDFAKLPAAMGSSFQAMDVLFYGFALYEGYKFSVLKATTSPAGS